MKQYIDNKNEAIVAFSKQLSKGMADGMRELEVPVETVNQSGKGKTNANPYLLMGGTALTTGVIGRACSSSENSGWAYLLCAVGVASLAYGLSLRRKGNRVEESPVFNYNKIIRSQVVSVDEILDKTKAEWNVFMEHVKEDLQGYINSLSLDEDKKMDCLSHTYYVQQLDLDSCRFNDLLRALPQDSDFVKRVNVLRSDFAEEVEQKILKTAQIQIDEYEKVNVEI